jgi:assimilatory nitrate reductase catalytic subunit
MRVEWHGVLYVRDAITPDVTWWARVTGDGFTRYEMAGRDKLFERATTARAEREAWARAVMRVPATGGDYLDYEDVSSGIYRAAFVADNKLIGCVFISACPELPSREWLSSLASKKRLDDIDRRGLLAGRALMAGPDAGPLVCSCFRVGRGTIADAIKCHRLKTPAAVGVHLKAGTNCGSCLPEISALIASSAVVP